MNVKGFIIEDNQGREFVLVCEPPYRQLGGTFSLRGWQRRRLVPLQYTEGELRKITGGVLATLHDLFRNLPRLLEHSHGVSSGKETAHSLQQSGKR
jgi:predicted component of type VI protein secretion system